MVQMKAKLMQFKWPILCSILLLGRGEVVRYKVDNGTHNLNLRKSFLKSVLAEMMNL